MTLYNVQSSSSAEWSVSLEIFSTVDFFRKIVLSERTASFTVSLLSYTNLDECAHEKAIALDQLYVLYVNAREIDHS